MACWVSRTVGRFRVGVLGCVLALAAAACGQVSVSSSGSPPVAGPAGVPASGGSSPPPSAAPPVISGTPATSVVAGQNYSFTPAASSPSGSALSFSITNLPGWASFNSHNGQLSGTPTAASVGTFANIQISASDGQSTAALAAFAITVVAPLTISGSPPTSAVVGSSYSFLPTTNSPPGSAVTFAVQNAPAWGMFNASTGELSGTPTQAGVFANIVISASDGVQTSQLAAFSITVSNPSP